jgi:hypothetical protein
MEKIFTILIIQDPPIGAWCFGMKGRHFNVVDRGSYYLLSNDIHKTENKRCIVKSHATII